MPQIIIDIKPDGQTTVDAQGYNGTQCKDATKAIEKALGVTTKDETKPELSQSAKQKADQR
ncbi:MAG: DUF2997 domain-containing protein [Planctomycetes bacterium]|nr:DUF2997 domain-containing protein [Planctomycetota bacterium]